MLNTIYNFLIRIEYQCFGSIKFRGEAKVFLKISLCRKDYNTKDNRDQYLVPSLQQISLSLSYLLPNAMSKELFREASKSRNKKQEEKGKLNRKNWKGNLS